MRTRFQLPGPDVPLVLPNGFVNPVWYDKLQTISQFVNLFAFIDFPAPNPRPSANPAVATITNGQIVKWNTANGLFEPGAN